MIKGYDLTISFTSREEDGTRYLVEVYQQPFHRWAIAWLYHFYDMRVFKLPGARKLERWHHKTFGKGDFTFIPIFARQDIRCAFLREKGKVILHSFEVDEDTYIRMGGRT